MGTRTRTSSEGEVATFRYDAEGRLLSEAYAPAYQGGYREYDRTYEYSGPLLVAISGQTVGVAYVVTYEYDAADNLVRSESGGVWDYYYDCW